MLLGRCLPFLFSLIFFFQGDYEMVISDYGRAKSLFAETDIKIFKKGVTAVLCEDVFMFIGAPNK